MMRRLSISLSFRKRNNRGMKIFGDDEDMTNTNINGMQSNPYSGSLDKIATNPLTDIAIQRSYERIKPDEEVIKEINDISNYIDALYIEKQEQISDINKSEILGKEYEFVLYNDNTIEVQYANSPEDGVAHHVEEEYLPGNIILIRNLVRGHYAELVQKYRTEQETIVINSLWNKHKTIAISLIKTHVYMMHDADCSYEKIFKILSEIYEDFRPTNTIRNCGEAIGTYDYETGKFNRSVSESNTSGTIRLDKSKIPDAF